MTFGTMPLLVGIGNIEFLREAIGWCLLFFGLAAVVML